MYDPLRCVSPCSRHLFTHFGSVLKEWHIIQWWLLNIYISCCCLVQETTSDTLIVLYTFNYTLCGPLYICGFSAIHNNTPRQHPSTRPNVNVVSIFSVLSFPSFEADAFSEAPKAIKSDKTIRSAERRPDDIVVHLPGRHTIILRRTNSEENRERALFLTSPPQSTNCSPRFYNIVNWSSAEARRVPESTKGLIRVLLGIFRWRWVAVAVKLW